MAKSTKNGKVAGASLANYGFAVLAGVLGLALTTWAWQSSMRDNAAVELERFDHFTQLTTSTLKERLKNYTTIVRSGQSFFESSTHVRLSEWHSFVQHIVTDGHYPAIVNFDYVAHVLHDQEKQYAARMRQSDPAFVLHDWGKQAPHCVVQYEEPNRGVDSGVGYDICAYYNTIRNVLKRTIVGGSVGVSDSFTIPQRPGFKHQRVVVIAGAVHDVNSDTDPLVTGWVTMQLSIHRLLHGIMPSQPAIQLHVVGLKGAKNGMRLLRGSRVSDGAPPCRHSLLTTPCLQAQSAIELPGGRQWLLVMQQEGSTPASAWYIVIAGLIISILLALVFVRWAHVRADALSLASDMTGALRDSENMLTAVADNVLEGIFRSDADGGLIYVNQSMVELFGYRSANEMRVATKTQIYAAPHKNEELVDLLKRQGKFRGVEIDFVRRDGSRFVGVMNGLAVYGQDGNMAYWDGAVSDITARKTIEDRVRYLARFDSLTDVANRATFHEQGRHWLSRAAQAGRCFAIFYIDLDRFKTVNDYLGHSGGDKVLKAVSRRIRHFIGAHDLVGRHGGDEFIVLLSTVVDIDGARDAAQQLLEEVSCTYGIDGYDIVVTPSIGVSLYPDHGDTVERLIDNADAAMYLAKARGRNNVQLFTADLDVERRKRAELESDLREAVNRDELQLVYQPQVEIATGSVVGGEALVRWEHPRKGIISPLDFIPIAEQSGDIIAIGEWVLREACRQNRQWQRTGLSIVPIAVNISAVQFLRHALDKTVDKALSDANLEARFLELELTETVVMQDIGKTVELLDLMQRTGIEFAIDDFGTGYSSLSYLRWFKISKLKIDKSFVDDLTTNANNLAIVKAVVALARSFKLRVLAEGVETAEQLEALREQGCDDVQGYYFSRPVDPESFAAILRNGIGPAVDNTTPMM